MRCLWVSNEECGPYKVLPLVLQSVHRQEYGDEVAKVPELHDEIRH
jgi:hypothetical protein